MSVPGASVIKLARDKCKSDPEEHKAYLQRGGEDYDIVKSPPVLRSLLLVAKLHEEAEEIRADLTNPEEYADLIQVVFDLAALNGVAKADIKKALGTKYARKGGFSNCNVMVRNIEYLKEPVRDFKDTFSAVTVLKKHFRLHDPDYFHLGAHAEHMDHPKVG